MSKYKKKFAKLLMQGMRGNGESVAEVCLRFGLKNSTSYWNWVKQHPEFKEAHEFGELQHEAYFMRLNRDVCSGKEKGNAGQLQFTLTNKFGWSTKIETKTDSSDNSVRTININVLAPKDEPKIIEHIDTTNVIELKPDHD